MTGLLPSDGALAKTQPADFERRLTDAALAGAGWPQLLGLVRAATRRNCRLVGPDGALLASTDTGSGLSLAAADAVLADDVTFVVARDGWRARALPMVCGGRTLGLLLLAEPASAHQFELLHRAVTAIAIEAVRQDTMPISRFVDAGSVIASLRRGEVGSGPDDVRRSARGVGLDLARPGCGAVLRYSGTRRRAWATAVAWLDRPVECDGLLARLIVADGLDLHRVRAQLELSTGPGAVRGACGTEAHEPGAYRASFDEAARLLRFGRRAGTEVLPYAESGLLQLLLEAPSERLRWFVGRHLGPILARPELLVTLRAWLAASGSRQVVSEQLHLHRNSVGYRVGLLKSLLGVDPLVPEHAAVLHAALAAHDLLESDAGKLI